MSRERDKPKARRYGKQTTTSGKTTPKAKKKMDTKHESHKGHDPKEHEAHKAHETKAHDHKEHESHKGQESKEKPEPKPEKPKTPEELKHEQFVTLLLASPINAASNLGQRLTGEKGNKYPNEAELVDLLIVFMLRDTPGTNKNSQGDFIK